MPGARTAAPALKWTPLAAAGDCDERTQADPVRTCLRTRVALPNLRLPGAFAEVSCRLPALRSTFQSRLASRRRTACTFLERRRMSCLWSPLPESPAELRRVVSALR